MDKTDKNIWYCAVRKAIDDGHEWKDISTIDALPYLAEEKAHRQNKIITGWAKENPVIRIAKIKIEEIKTK